MAPVGSFTIISTWSASAARTGGSRRESPVSKAIRPSWRRLELENRRLAELLELKDAIGLNVVGADVIGSDATGLARTLIIGRGAAGGLKSNMAVICGEGVVGKLVAISPNAAKVLRIDDHNAAVDAFDQRSRARGIVAGVVDNGMVMKYVERTEDVRVGDPVVTSGLDGIFPQGLLIGRVSRIKRGGPGLFLNVEVAPAVNFGRTRAGAGAHRTSAAIR